VSSPRPRSNRHYGTQEQRQLAERVRAARGHGALIADFERRAAKLERLARPLEAPIYEPRKLSLTPTDQAETEER